MGDNNQKATHLLASLGILASFSIAKKINKKDIDAIANKLKKSKKPISKQQISKALADKAKKDLINEIPPGLIIPERVLQQEELNEMYEELGYFSEFILNEMKEQKYNKHQLCFIINYIIGEYKLTEQDFEDFGRKMSEFYNLNQEDGDNYNEEDDDDDD